MSKETLRDLNDFNRTNILLNRLKALGHDVLLVLRHEVPTTPEEAIMFDDMGMYHDPELRLE